MLLEDLAPFVFDQLLKVAPEVENDLDVILM